MNSPNSAGVVLNQVQSTLLYQPQQLGKNENLWFLLWDASIPPTPIPLEDTWAASGKPPNAGYFLFLDTLPPVNQAAAFEKQMRAVLPLPSSSAFAWVAYSTSSNEATIQTLLKTKLDNANKPVVDGDTQLVLLPGQEAVGFSDGAAVSGIYVDQLITGVVVTYPQLAGAQLAGMRGVSLPLNGDLVGCIQFNGLTNTIGSSDIGDSARKSFVQVVIDPLNPLNPNRNYERFTGEDFVLTQIDNSYFISRAS